MPSDYAKWLQRDVEKNVAAEYTQKQKLKNWWSYHKWLVLGGIVLLAIVIELVANALGIGQIRPDYQVAYVGSATLEDETAQEIVQWLEAMGEDLNGDGQVVVQLNQYPFPDASDGDETLAAIRSASEISLVADISECDSYFFLLDDPDDFQLRYQVLALADGSCPEDTDVSGTDKVIAWTGPDAGLELYLGRRCFYAENENQVDNEEGCASLWDRLTEEALS
ncbi:MAG: hypothetical protein LUH41_00695 [Clostridiales bacterium]|nr:hypothetical protein [Clostridiales bacterium]